MSFGLYLSLISTKGVIEGLEWVVDKHTARANAKSVANMSLGGDFSQSLNNAVKAAVEAGVIVVVSAGNDNADACLDSSPASEPTAITVGSTTNSDTRSVSARQHHVPENLALSFHYSQL